MFCCLLCLNHTHTHTHKNRDTLRSPPGQLALRERHRRSTYCCCGKPPLLYCCWNVRAGLYLYTFGLRTCADPTTPSYLAVSSGLAGGVRGKRDLRGYFYHPPLAAARVEALLEGLLLRLALAGPAGDPNNALLRRRHEFYVADTLRSPPGQLGGRERHRRSTYCCCGTPPLLDWCWTHVRVGLYRFALYASRRRLRAWPGGGGGGARSWTRSLLFYASRRQLRPWPGWGGGGCAALVWSLPFYLSLNGLSTLGQAMLGHWFQHHLRL